MQNTQFFLPYAKPISMGIIHTRYKRFFADITLENGLKVTAHVPTTGPMLGCWKPDFPCIVSYHGDDSKRKLPYSLEATFNGDSWVGINTQWPNKLVHFGLQNNFFPTLLGYKSLKPECKLNSQTRFDFFLSQHENNDVKDCWVEVKNTTLYNPTTHEISFPDAVTTRGQKHLEELIELKKQNFRCVMIYVVPRIDAKIFNPIQNIDPKYATLLKLAMKVGVEIIVPQFSFTPSGIEFIKFLQMA